MAFTAFSLGCHEVVASERSALALPSFLVHVLPRHLGRSLAVHADPGRDGAVVELAVALTDNGALDSAVADRLRPGRLALGRLDDVEDWRAMSATGVVHDMCGVDVVAVLVTGFGCTPLPHVRRVRRLATRLAPLAAR